VSQQLADEVAPLGLTKVAFVPNAVAGTVARPEAASSHRRILVLGSLIPRKQPLAVLEAFGAIAARTSDAELVYVGEGSLRPSIQVAAARVGLTDRVAIKGYVSDDVRTAMLRDAVIFVLYSLEEGMSLALLEAMSAGKAIIASDIPANRSLVDGESSVLVPPNDTERLSTAMSLLLENPFLRQKLGTEARKRSERYSIERIGTLYGQMYASAETKEKHHSHPGEHS
jgi:glycosyltransferase involved in cell wall biosynthesis